MDSFSISKGYGKIGETDGEEPLFSDRPGRRRAVIIAAVSLILLTVTIVSLIAALHHESGESDSDDDSNEITDPIRYACKLTHYQEACFTSISSINAHPNPDPVTILSLLLRSTITELGNELLLPKRMMSKVKDHRSVAALEDCVSLLNDAVGSLNKSEIRVLEGGEELSETGVGDLRTWISAAMTDLETCVDGLVEMEATVVEEVRKMVQGGMVGMSNSLAILKNWEGMKEDMKEMGDHGG